MGKSSSYEEKYFMYLYKCARGSWERILVVLHAVPLESQPRLLATDYVYIRWVGLLSQEWPYDKFDYRNLGPYTIANQMNPMAFPI